MTYDDHKNLAGKIKQIFIGKAINPRDKNLFHKLSLIAFFAWVGLGADGLSSSCYGPEETFLALGTHKYLAIIVGLASAITIFVISSSYRQIIELFPSGGGGYLVASRLLSPKIGVISGSALLIDYVLTITLSIASGADAIFSFLPVEWLEFKLYFAVFGVIFICILNLRGIKESVVPLVPIFLTFIITHVFLIIYSFTTHLGDFSQVAENSSREISSTVSQLGLFGTFLIIMRAYSMGAGTYTGIEAVCNGLPILREPKVKTAKKTMTYMTISLSFMVLGLIFSYLFYNIQYVHGKTLNAVLFTTMTLDWGFGGQVLVLVTLISEAALLFIAAQTGFLDGPRVLANMALDRYMPTKFAMLSDRFVTYNGIIIMSTLSLLLMIFSKGSVRFLVVLYAINVFIDFCLSQSGMVRHWWQVKKKNPSWKRKITINGIGLLMTTFILVSIIFLKFEEGGWITLAITGTVMLISLGIKKHYNNTMVQLKRLDNLVEITETAINEVPPESIEAPHFDKKAKTAVIFVNGFNGLGLHTLFGIMRLFSNSFRNYIFVQVGVIDAGNFKGIDEIKNLEESTKTDLDKYVKFLQTQGFYAKSYSFIGNDIISQLDDITNIINKEYPNCIYFGGQLVFPKETLITRLLHNNILFTIQRKFYLKGLPFMILPIRV